MIRLSHNLKSRFHLWFLVLSWILGFSFLGRPFGSILPPERGLSRAILEDKRLDQVWEMGSRLLQSGMNAGSGYKEVWIRDLNTFIGPLLDVVPPDPVRRALLIFFEFQGETGDIVDGYVPADQANVGYRYRTSESVPEFKAHKNTVETDQESSLVQAVCRYVNKTGDATILEEAVGEVTVLRRLEMALDYPLTHRFSKEYGLVWGATTADWGDVQPEHEWGVELDANSHRAIDIYDNALLMVAIKDFSEMLTSVEGAHREKWINRHQTLRTAVRAHLWDAQSLKFRAHLYLEESPFEDKIREDRIYFHGGTGVAMEAGLLTPAEILISYGQMKANLRLSGAATLGLTLYPPYPEGSFKNKGMGPYSYQNGGDWTWFGARIVRQLAEAGYVEPAYRELIPMLERVIKHGGFHEWWSIENEPRGSGQFRGSAGVLIEAIRSLRQWAEQNDGS